MFFLSFLGTGLEAYSIGPVPIPWLSASCTTVYAIGLFLRHRRVAMPRGAGILTLFLAWAAVVTVINVLLYDYSQRLPVAATTSYPVFLSLRFFTICAFGSQLYLTHWLLEHGLHDSMLRVVLGIATFLTLAALYIYLAQVFGLWEPPRTRTGTSGEAQSIVFNYAFHRAMGTFREPSNLGQWLLVPFFLAMLSKKRSVTLQVVFMGLTLLLTGSLTCILGAVIGLSGALLLVNPLHRDNVKVILSLAIVLTVAYAGFGVMAVAYSGDQADLLGVVRKRVVPMLAGEGMRETNRALCYEYFDSVPVPFLGEGLGNANLTLSEYLNTPVVSSFLNLYYNTLYTTGYVGFTIMAAFLVLPLWITRRHLRTANRQRSLVLLGAYVSCLAIFYARTEELTPMFAVVYALVCHNATGDPLSHLRGNKSRLVGDVF